MGIPPSDSANHSAGHGRNLLGTHRLLRSFFRLKKKVP